jgi:hypothetical protein
MRPAVLGLALALGLGACAGGPRPFDPARSGTGLRTSPWDVPASLLGQQALFRLRIDGPEGEGTLRLLLRLVSPTRFQLVVSDRLGRVLYGFEAADGGGRLIDHQRMRVCPVGTSFELEGVPLEPIPLAAVPALLLGRVPDRPVTPGLEVPAEGDLAFEDGQGRQWSVTLVAGQPVAWTLAENGRPALWWRRDGRQCRLSDRVRGAQMTWEETLREPLPPGDPPPLVVPGGYGAGPCRGEASPRSGG